MNAHERVREKKKVFLSIKISSDFTAQDASIAVHANDLIIDECEQVVLLKLSFVVIGIVFARPFA